MYLNLLDKQLNYECLELDAVVVVVMKCYSPSVVTREEDKVPGDKVRLQLTLFYVGFTFTKSVLGS